MLFGTAALAPLLSLACARPRPPRRLVRRDGRGTSRRRRSSPPRSSSASPRCSSPRPARRRTTSPRSRSSSRRSPSSPSGTADGRSLALAGAAAGLAVGTKLSLLAPVGALFARGRSPSGGGTRVPFVVARPGDRRLLVPPQPLRHRQPAAVARPAARSPRRRAARTPRRRSPSTSSPGARGRRTSSRRSTTSSARRGRSSSCSPPPARSSPSSRARGGSGSSRSAAGARVRRHPEQRRRPARRADRVRAERPLRDARRCCSASASSRSSCGGGPRSSRGAFAVAPARHAARARRDLGRRAPPQGDRARAIALGLAARRAGTRANGGRWCRGRGASCRSPRCGRSSATSSASSTPRRCSRTRRGRRSACSPSTRGRASSEGARIAVTGTTGSFFQYPLHGPELDNEVELIGVHGAARELHAGRELQGAGRPSSTATRTPSSRPTSTSGTRTARSPPRS